MNRDIVAGKWQQVKGQIKEQWGKLTDDDLQKVEGRFDRMVGVLRERYGYAREEAERQLNEYYAANGNESWWARTEAARRG
jgi:uncharacterized protein YjbJ (UPF0337 family)